MKKFFQRLFNRKTFLRFFLPLILIIALALIAWLSFRPKTSVLTPDQAKIRAENFINDFLMQPGEKATVSEVTPAYGLYKMKVDITSGQVESYLSQDGKLFFPQALDIDEIGASQNSGDPSSSGAPATVSAKSDKPTVELFVMSYCPYGTQMEKGILPALAALGNKIDFQLKFVDYAMHGQQELAENLTQYCIASEQNSKLQAYLGCFLQAGDSASCLSSAGINKTKLDSCVSQTDQKYKVTSNFTNNVGYQGSYPSFNVFKADNEKYGVSGSPTLVIDGQSIQSGRDSASLLATICSAFNTPPAACDTALSSATPGPGFGTSTTDSAAAANCE